MVELGRDGDLNFFKPRVGPVCRFPPSPLCYIGRQELLGGLPRLPQGGASFDAAVVKPGAYSKRLPH
ncbi:hypothetical protein HAX54_037944 [Datura stramonium]|uniref:Uncharacterized protein n=1 Tax=Datura stramonium TaxID=4076 RepID=A0ABS8VJ28_DATST|nr:hypothetical protein [Datura stramonium]